MTPAVPALRQPRAQPAARPSAPPPASRGGDGGGGDGGPFGHYPGGSTPAPASAAVALVGVWLLVGAIVILFAAFTSTFVVRRAEADWRAGPVPVLLWVNTAVLLASGAALEWARAAGRRADLDGVRTRLAGAAVLGTLFLAGQWAAWGQLTGAGILMSSGPHSAFFYLLTGTHALHVAGGVAALLYVLWRARQATRVAEAAAMLPATAVYWHFVDVLWLYVFILLFV